jgi:hypothetical protein
MGPGLGGPGGTSVRCLSCAHSMSTTSAGELAEATRTAVLVVIHTDARRCGAASSGTDDRAHPALQPHLLQRGQDILAGHPKLTSEFVDPHAAAAPSGCCASLAVSLRRGYRPSAPTDSNVGASLAVAPAPGAEVQSLALTFRSRPNPYSKTQAETDTFESVPDRERDILKRAVASVAEQASKADALIDDLQAAGLREDGPVLQAKLLRLELLKVKGDLERELGRWVLDCRRCNRRVHWVSGIGVTRATWRTQSQRRITRRCSTARDSRDPPPRRPGL